jgi:nitrate reductase gamma subunit
VFNYSSNSRNKVHISGMIKYCIMNERSKAVVVVVVVFGGLCAIIVLISKSMLVVSNRIQDRIKMKKLNNDSFQKCYSL